MVDGMLIKVKENYTPYQSAKPVLCANLGKFCSYCEDSEHKSGDLDVEHIQPKSLTKYAHLETNWENFLLGCRTCNGPGNKWNKDVDPKDIHMPHINNTYKSFLYKEGGVVVVNPEISPLSKKRAEGLMSLVGLDKGPGTKGDGGRCEMRRETWNMATEMERLYSSGNIAIDYILNLSKQRGGWSIWFTVFNKHNEKHDEVRRRLIAEFPGTVADCFDHNNHYEPIDRNPGKEDPV